MESTENPENVQLMYVDTSLFKNGKFVRFLGRQKTNSIVYVPAMAASIAKEMQDAVRGHADPSKLVLDPMFAYKALGHEGVAKALTKAGCNKIDVASLYEAKRCKRLVGSGGLSHANTSAGQEELRALVRLGCRAFVVDSSRVLEWLYDEYTKLPSWKKRGKLRITLRVALPSSSVDQGSKFGASMDELEGLAKLALQLGMIVLGVSYHLGAKHSYQFTRTEEFGINRPAQANLFSDFGNAIREIASICNYLYAKGLIERIVNCEGGHHRSYGNPEYDLAAVLRSQVEAFSLWFNYPVILMYESGRPYADCGVGKFKAIRIKEGGPDGYPYVVLDTSLKVGPYDMGFEPGTVFLKRHVDKGEIYTPEAQPHMFRRVHLGGYSCTASDQAGFYDDRKFSLVPIDIQEGDVVYISSCGAYTASAFSPQASLEARFSPWLGRIIFEGIRGFNGIPWTRYITYKGPLS